MSKGQQFETPADLSAKQADAVRSALESVIRSDAFAGSKQCQDLLRLLVQHALSGELEALSERMIGVEMFGRPADYDTSNDAVVLVRAAISNATVNNASPARTAMPSPKTLWQVARPRRKSSLSMLGRSSWTSE